MSDLTERLRTLEGWNTTGPKALMFEAADEIDKLRQQLTLADCVYELVVLERDALQVEVKNLTKIIDDAWGEA